MNERRRNRPESAEGALSVFLRACRLRAGAEALVVADDHGFLVGGSAADRRDLQVEAAWLSHPRTQAKRHSFAISDVRLHVGALGATRSELAQTLREVAQGVVRILA